MQSPLVVFSLRGFPVSILLLAVCVLVLAGCRTHLLNLTRGPVPEAYRKPLVEGEPQYNNWRGADLTLDYNYLKTQNTLDLAGRISFDRGTEMNFGNIDNLRMSIYFLDNQGNILGSSGIYSTYWLRSESNPTFRTRLTVPPGASAIAFSYDGQASSIDGSGNDGGGRVTAWIHDGPT